ncbi:MAG: hypothetical protein JXB04_02685 [Kiritimatiellae bacterium]|nr:hypothetical protein [Kiritimatiellia bacterium]
MKSCPLALAASMILAAAVASAQVPELINYQGRLVDGTNLASGSIELSLRLYDPGDKLIYEDSNTVNVVDGLYAAIIGDDPTPASGELSWALTKGPLTIEVLVDGVALSPREPLNAVGCALLAAGVTNGAILEAMLADGAVTGQKLGPASVTAGKIDTGAVDTDHMADDAVTSDKIDDGTITAADVAANTFWKTDGNTGTTPGTHFVGTTDNQPLDLRVNNTRAFRLQPIPGNTPHVIGGASDNACAAGYGGTIGGGAANTITGAAYGIIGGGQGNTVFYHTHGTIGGGENNYIDTSHAVIAGGRQNQVLLNANHASIGGGHLNIINPESENSVIAGGYNNVLSNTCRYSVIGGGQQNAMHDQCFVDVIAGGQFNTILDGADWCSIGGGERNTIRGSYQSVIAGGQGNYIHGDYSVIAGGQSNIVIYHHSLAAGRRARAGSSGTFVWADSTDAEFSSTADNQFLVRASGGVGIGTNVTPEQLTVAGNVKADSFLGSGASLTGVNADQVDGYDASNASGAVPVNNGVLNTNLNADMLDGLHAASFSRWYSRNGSLAAGNVVTLAVPNYAHFTLQLSSGHPHSGGLAIVHGFENDWNIGVVYTKYNGDGTSGYGGAHFLEMTTSNLVTFGSGANQYTVRCPGEAAGDHNIVLTASGLEMIYSLSY